MTATATAADDVPPSSPFDRGARKALELTFREASHLGHNDIGTEHILLALLELESGAGVLSDLGVDKATAEATLAATLADLPLGGAPLSQTDA